LTALAVGESARVSRVADDDPDKLRYLGSIGLYPEATVRLLERLPFAGPLRLVVNDEEHYLGADLAETIQILRQPPATDERAQNGPE
jgi:DtxR family Mn-dependent transcriptional regulator